MKDPNWMTVHFPGDNVPVMIRKSSVIGFHQAPKGTNLILSGAAGLIAIESPDEVADMLAGPDND